jgi:hypothetical protein
MIVTGVTGATRESEFEPKATQRVTIRRENTEEKRRRNARKRKSEGGREEHKVKSLKKNKSWNGRLRGRSRLHFCHSDVRS